MTDRLYLSPPYMCGNEQKYVQQAFDSNWIAPLGSNVTAFENEVCAYVGAKYALATCSGTAAIHLALRYFDVGQNDLVFCSDLTFSGSCNPICYQGAQPVFIDSEPESLNMSPIALEKAFAWAKQQDKMPKAVIIVDLYGQSADYDALLPICKHYGVSVIEDAAEAMGAKYYGEHCGTFGDAGIYSFNGNKIVTTSGGGMVISNDAEAIKKMLFWATQARENALHYEHKEVGYNYRLSNVCAGIGRGQLEGLVLKMAKRKAIYERYETQFKTLPIRMQPVSTKGTPNYWMNVALIKPEAKTTPYALCDALDKQNIEARPAWKPMHLQPIFKDCPYFAHEPKEVGVDVFKRGICLPSGEGMTETEQEQVVQTIKKEIVNG